MCSMFLRFCSVIDQRWCKKWWEQKKKVAAHKAQSSVRHVLSETLPLKLPWMTKTEFLLTISIQNQEDKWWESRKVSTRVLLVDPATNSQK